MPRTRSLAFSELKIGIIAVVAMVLAALLIIAVGGQAGFFWQQYRLRTKFTNVQGMKSGAVVRVAGKDVGKVTDVELSGALVEVSMVVNKNVQSLITGNSKASMGSLSLLGEPIVEITAAPGGPVLADNAYLESTGSGSPITDLTNQAKASLEEVNKLVADMRAGKGTMGKLFTDEAAYRDFDALLVTANRVAGGLDGTRGTAGRLINDPALYNSMKKSIDDLDAAIAPLKSSTTPLGRLLNDQAMGQSLSNAVTGMENAAGKLGKSDNTAGALLNDRQLYDRLNGVTDRIDKLIATLQGSTGTAGSLINDRQLYDNMNSTMKEMQALLADIRKDPKKFLTVRVSIF
jgi:phospholipid/cholesterol/gamma-HCH transport system substrate-binding protein